MNCNCFFFSLFYLLPYLRNTSDFGWEYDQLILSHNDTIADGTLWVLCVGGTSFYPEQRSRVDAEGPKLWVYAIYLLFVPLHPPAYRLLHSALCPRRLTCVVHILCLLHPGRGLQETGERGE